MLKKTNKLSLTGETIRKLGVQALTKIRGGEPPAETEFCTEWESCFTCFASCCSSCVYLTNPSKCRP